MVCVVLCAAFFTFFSCSENQYPIRSCYRLLKSSEAGLRLPIHHGVRNIQRALYAVCESYDDCIANFQFLIDNYVDYNAKYCVNLSSIRRKKILNGLKWMKHYLDRLYNVHDPQDQRSRLVSDSDFQEYNHRPKMLPTDTQSEESLETTSHHKVNVKGLSSNVDTLKKQLSSHSGGTSGGGISGDESAADIDSTDDTPKISHVTIPTTTGSPLMNGIRLPDATPSTNPNYLGMFLNVLYIFCVHGIDVMWIILQCLDLDVVLTTTQTDHLHGTTLTLRIDVIKLHIWILRLFCEDKNVCLC